MELEQNFWLHYTIHLQAAATFHRHYTYLRSDCFYSFALFHKLFQLVRFPRLVMFIDCRGIVVSQPVGKMPLLKI